MTMTKRQKFLSKMQSDLKKWRKESDRMDKIRAQIKKNPSKDPYKDYKRLMKNVPIHLKGKDDDYDSHRDNSL